jgi:ABC-type sugar transport system permease subunit
MAVAVGRSPRRVRVWWPAWFLLPPVALFAGFVVLPIVLAVLLSFCSWDGSSAIQFNGLANWQQFIHDSSALTAIYFLPMLISAASLGILWNLLLSPVNGGVTYASTHFGLFFLDHQWLSDPDLVLGTVIVLVAWEFIPFHSLLFEAGARQIPRSIYEAAAIDGIGPYRRFFRITLPMLRHTIVTSSTLNLVGSLTVFDLIYTLTGGGPGQSTRVLALAQYLEGFESLNFGYASALALVLGVLAVIVSMLLIGVTGFGKMRSQSEGA